MPTAIRCKLCNFTTTSLLVDSVSSAHEAGNNMNLHMQEQHLEEYTQFVNQVVIPNSKLYIGMAIQNYLTELTEDSFNDSLKAETEKNIRQLIAILKGDVKKEVKGESILPPGKGCNSINF